MLKRRNVNQQCGESHHSGERRDTDYLQGGVYQTEQRGSGDRESEGGAGEAPLVVNGTAQKDFALPLMQETRLSRSCLKKAAEEGSAYVLR